MVLEKLHFKNALQLYFRYWKLFVATTTFTKHSQIRIIFGFIKFYDSAESRFIARI